MGMGIVMDMDGDRFGADRDGDGDGNAKWRQELGMEMERDDSAELDSNWEFCLYQMGMEMGRKWRWTKMEIEYWFLLHKENKV